MAQIKFPKCFFMVMLCREISCSYDVSIEIMLNSSSVHIGDLNEIVFQYFKQLLRPSYSYWQHSLFPESVYFGSRTNPRLSLPLSKETVLSTPPELMNLIISDHTIFSCCYFHYGHRGTLLRTRGHTQLKLALGLAVLLVSQCPNKNSFH